MTEPEAVAESAGVIVRAEDRPRALSPAARKQRQTAALKHGAYATTHGVQLRNRRLRGHVTRLVKANPALADKPRNLIRRYVELDTLAAIVFNEVYESGPLNADGEPKRLLGDYLRIMGELRALGAVLGLLSPGEDDVLSILNGGSR
jgi:hypothetical protein